MFNRRVLKFCPNKSITFILSFIAQRLLETPHKNSNKMSAKPCKDVDCGRENCVGQSQQYINENKHFTTDLSPLQSSLKHSNC